MTDRSARIGVVGVGNCASSFVQGVAHYAGAEANVPVPGLMNLQLGGYHEISAAFDASAAGAEARTRTLRFIEGADRDLLQ